MIENYFFILMTILFAFFAMNYFLIKREYFIGEESCNDFFKNNSFCSLNKDENICQCVYQKDSIKYQFNSPSGCCQEDCTKIPLSKCNDRINNDFGVKEIPYYCNIAGKCVEYKGTISNSHISANNCGIDPLNNQLLLPYNTLEECKKKIDECDQYNNKDFSFEFNKENCLKNVNCGYCSDDSGGGKCISGTATGPNDLLKYFYCNKNARNDVNKYTHY